MGRKSKKGMRAYVDIEPGLREANQKYIVWDKLQTHKTRIVVEKIVRKIIEEMMKQSPSFARLYTKTVGSGSIYNGLKVGEPEEFDFDILLKLPESTKPVLKEDVIPGFIQMKLENFSCLERTEPELYRNMRNFVDDQNYLLTDQMKSAFMQSTFDKTVTNYFPGNIIKIGRTVYKIVRVQSGKSPAHTLTVEGPAFNGSIDLVPCILLTKDYWPRGGFRTNPYSTPNEFFIVAKRPKRDHPHIERYWRLSFQLQERIIIFNRFFLKPTIRIFKRMRDRFGHSISSYAIKTVFMWELFHMNTALDECTPDLWARMPFSYCVVYMLEKYIKFLENKIPYFWNSKLKLLDNLSDQQIEHYREDVARMVQDIKQNPTPITVLKYLS